jgi:hypothetical protein
MFHMLKKLSETIKVSLEPNGPNHIPDEWNNVTKAGGEGAEQHKQHSLETVNK